MTRSNLARACADSRPGHIPALRQAIVVILGMAMIAVSMVMGAPLSHASGTTVVITGSLSPKDLSVTPGTQVTWVNRDNEAHRLRANDGGITFDSGGLKPGDQWSYTFKKAGTANYHDKENSSNAAYFGTVVVGSAGPSGPTTPVPGPPAPPPPMAAIVTIGGNFSPVSVSVSVGGTVTWTNKDGKPHTVTANDGSFDSATIKSGASWSHVFSAAGTFAYVCAFHSDMRGTVTVPTKTGTTPPPLPPAPPAPKAPVPPGHHTPPLPPPPAGSTAVTHQVAVSDNSFSPAVLNARVGDTVTWTNKGKMPHTVTGGPWDAPLSAGQTFSTVLRATGKVSYVCSYHSNMAGTVNIAAALPGTKLPPPAPKGGGGSTGGTGAHSTHQPPAGTGASSAGSVGPAAASHRVAISDTGYSPAVLNAKVGDTVTWTNNGKMPHTVTGGPWDAAVKAGQSFSTVLRATGTISYLCSYHPNMTGTVKVSAAPAGTKLPPPSAGGGISGGSAAPAAHAGQAGASAAVAPGSQKHTVKIRDNAYSPDPLVARVGDSVTWVNEDPIPHTVTGGPWDEMIEAGGTFTTVLQEPGTVKYVCTMHPGMKGSIEIKPAAPGTKVAPATSAAKTTHAEPAAKPAPVADATGQTHLVTIKDFVYSPATLQARVGDTVTFVNEDTAPHTATAKDGSFDSGMLKKGEKYTLKLTKVGTFDYLCAYHPDMVGTIVVAAANTPAAPAQTGTIAAPDAMLSAGNIAGFGSGWIGLLVLLAGSQLRTRFRTRR